VIVRPSLFRVGEDRVGGSHPHGGLVVPPQIRVRLQQSQYRAVGAFNNFRMGTGMHLQNFVIVRVGIILYHASETGAEPSSPPLTRQYIPDQTAHKSGNWHIVGKVSGVRCQVPGIS